MSNSSPIIESIESTSQRSEPLPKFRPGDTIAVEIANTNGFTEVAINCGTAAKITIQSIVAGSSLDDIAPLSSIDRVISVTTDERIVSISTEDDHAHTRVVDNHVISSASINNELLNRVTDGVCN